MRKSLRRILIEREIRNAHEASYKKVMELAEKYFAGDLEKALNDEDFVKRMQSKVKKYWDKYLQGYNELEELERKQGFPAMKLCTKQLDEVTEYIPSGESQNC